MNHPIENDKRIIIAVDGFSSSGKSTMAKRLAQQIEYAYVDSGAMYRAVTLYCLQQGWILADGIEEEKLKSALPSIQISFQYNAEQRRNETLLNGIVVEDEIRGLAVSSNVSPVSALDFVRTHLVKQQQAMGENKGIVMDGRDIGSTVFPEAELKFFITASPEIRAQRRYEELQQKGDIVSYEAILENIKERDYLDQNRLVSPLRQVDDAIVLDNSQMTISEQDQFLLEKYREITHNYETGTQGLYR